MKPLDGDPGLLLRADRRCAALTLELDRLARTLEQASGSTAGRWSGAGAVAFGRTESGHRRTIEEVRAMVARIGGVTRSFAHELADAQLRVKRLPDAPSAERTAIEERITVLRRRYRQELRQVESDVTRLLLHRPVEPVRWTGPVLLPGGRPRWWGPRLPPDSHPRWTGPVCPPGGWRRDEPLDGQRWTGPVRPPGDLTWPQASVEPLPVPADRGPGATQLPWAPPWLGGSGDQPAHTRVQPIGAST